MKPCRDQTLINVPLLITDEVGYLFGGAAQQGDAADRLRPPLIAKALRLQSNSRTTELIIDLVNQLLEAREDRGLAVFASNGVAFSL